MEKRKKPTIYDVAQAAGVSKSLVSLVLNGSDLVSAEKRERVEAAIGELGYRRSRAAASLAAARSHTVGLLIEDFSNPWFVDLLRGLRAELDPAGFHVAVRENHGLTGAKAIEGFLDAQVEALVVAAEPGRDFDALGIPVVVSGNRLHAIEGADIVSADDVAGVQFVLDHLRALGHRRIGHVTGAGGSALKRYEAYQDWMADHGEAPRCAGRGNDTNEEGGYQGTLELLDAHPDTTAVFAANDTMALGARAALRERDRKVPAGVALVGYDNSQLASSRFLDLTTVDQQSLVVGRAAAETLLRRLDGHDGPPTVRVIEPELVVRSSSGSRLPGA